MSAALSFITPPPGLGATEFSLDEVDGAEGVYRLAVVVDVATRLFVLDPARFVPDYAPEISVGDLERIGVGADEQPLVLVTANPREEGVVSVNLMAPILVNADTGAAVQVILEGQDLPVRAELGLGV